MSDKFSVDLVEESVGVKAAISAQSQSFDGLSDDEMKALEKRRRTIFAAEECGANL
jgi:hypothetical protein